MNIKHFEYLVEARDDLNAYSDLFQVYADYYKDRPIDGRAHGDAIWEIACRFSQIANELNYVCDRIATGADIPEGAIQWP